MQSLSDIQKLVYDVGYSRYATAYAETPLIYPLITQRRETVSHPMQGDRAVAAVGLGDLVERPPGQRYEHDTMSEGYVRQMRIANFGKTLTVPAETVDAAGGMAALESRVASFASEVARGARALKERTVANFYQKGTLSAGDKSVFNQTFVENPDANAGKIYDGKPWFAATGNVHPFYAHTSDGVQGINLVASLPLSTANLQTHLSNLAKRAGFDERGNKISVNHGILLVPSELEWTARQILNSAQVAESANNAINVLNGRLTVVASSWLSDTASAAAWWTLDPGALQVYDEQVPRIRAWFDEEIYSYRMAVDVMFGAAPYDWRYAACNNKATS